MGAIKWGAIHVAPALHQSGTYGMFHLWNMRAYAKSSWSHIDQDKYSFL
jgi:hypothetical protein